MAKSKCGVCTGEKTEPGAETPIPEKPEKSDKKMKTNPGGAAAKPKPKKACAESCDFCKKEEEPEPEPEPPKSDICASCMKDAATSPDLPPSTPSTPQLQTQTNWIWIAVAVAIISGIGGYGIAFYKLL